MPATSVMTAPAAALSPPSSAFSSAPMAFFTMALFATLTLASFVPALMWIDGVLSAKDTEKWDGCHKMHEQQRTYFHGRESRRETHQRQRLPRQWSPPQPKRPPAPAAPGQTAASQAEIVSRLESDTVACGDQPVPPIRFFHTCSVRKCQTLRRRHKLPTHAAVRLPPQL